MDCTVARQAVVAFNATARNGDEISPEDLLQLGQPIQG
jgi:hypothetical protein